MRCPTCDATDLVMTERTGIEIDYCPKCRGVWLDRGELDKLIERAGQHIDVAPPVMQQQKQKPDDSYYGHQHERRKKSWFSELFD